MSSENNKVNIFIKTKFSNFPASECSFWNNGKQCVHHRRCDSDIENIVYNEGEFEFIEEPIIFKQESWEEHLLEQDKQIRYDECVDLNFVYDNQYINKFDYDKINSFVNKYNKTHSIKRKKSDYFYNTEGFLFFSKIRQKYIKQAELFSCVNDFELEPYGFKTEELIESCLYQFDYEIKRKKFYDENYKNFV